MTSLNDERYWIHSNAPQTRTRATMLRAGRRVPWTGQAILLLCGLSWLAAAAHGDEEGKPDAEERGRLLAATAERFFQPLVEHQWAQGLVVGIVDADGSHVFGFGRKTSNAPEPPDGDSLFEIGSVTKVFTGTLLADMVQQGLLSVDDPVNKFLPEEIHELRTAGREMRLSDLATHTSGLPRLPTNWTPQDASDPYADYSTGLLYEFLKLHAEPSFGASLGQWFGLKPKVNWEYSNLGVGLLGHVLERKAGRPYEELVLQHICRPLGMLSTRLKLDDALSARLIGGHDADGNPMKNWQFDCLAPCGGLRSSAGDLLKFVSANLELTETPLKPALALAHEPRYNINPNVAMGLNWLVRSDFAFHDGMTGGYSSFVAFSKPRRVGLVVLADTTVGGTSGLLNSVSVAFLKALIAEQPSDPPLVRKTVVVERSVLEKYAGSYSLVPVLVTFTVTCEEDRLFAQLTGQPRFRIFPETDNRFFYKVVDAQITFESDENGKVLRLVLHQNGADKSAARVPAIGAPVAP